MHPLAVGPVTIAALVVGVYVLAVCFIIALGTTSKRADREAARALQRERFERRAAARRRDRRHR